MKARTVALVLLLLPLAAAALPAGEASTPPPPRNSVWTVLTTVQATVQDNYATVRVIADIGNRGPDPEFPFQVRVPEDAFVTGLTVTRDGITYEGRIEAREAAREAYDEHKAQERTGGLVEKTRGSSVYSFLVNVAEFESVRAVLTYERYLAADQGVHTLPLEAPVSGFGQDLGARFDVRVAHGDGVTSAWSDPAGTAAREGQAWRLTHAVGPRHGDASTPLNVSYTLPATADGGSLVALVKDGKGYFAHRLRAPADARDMPLDLVLVLDVSGSMGGLKMRQMQDAASQAVGLLRAEDRLHLAFFSSTATSPWSGMRAAEPALRTRAAEEVRAAIAAGGTNIEDGIRTGFRAFEGLDWSAAEGRLPVLVFLTDGVPTSGITDKAVLRQVARQANAHGAHVFALAFGADADWGLVAALAQDGEGVALRVPEGAGAELDLRRFLGALTSPVLRDVRAVYDGAVQAHRRSAPVLFAGSELLVLGTFEPSLPRLTGTLAARAPEGPRRWNFSAELADAGRAGFLPRLVAYEEIRRLTELLAAEGPRADWITDIRELALEHGFVTDYTSLVVLLPERALRRCDPCFAPAGAQTTAPSNAPSAPSAVGATPSPPTSPTTPASPPAAPPPAAPPPSATVPPPPAVPPMTTPPADADSGLPPPSPAPADADADAAPPDEEVAATPGFEAAGLAVAALVALLGRRRRS